MAETYTRRDIEAGAGFFTSGEHTLVYQRGGEDVFVTDGKSSTPAPGWHLAGGGRVLRSGEPSLEWCDLR